MSKNKKVKLSDNSIAVLKRRYLQKDDQGRVIETPEEMFIRVADFIADADKNYDVSDDDIKKTSQRFYNIMSNLDFLPNSPTLMNAGRELGQLSACFVLPVDDSMEDIFETNKHAALIHKSGGGTGFSFSRLRPRDSIVASTSGVASGPVSFMKVFDSSTEAVKQGGTRRGANMGILRIDHPDILEFISCKEDTTEITNFNISVAITDEFMQAVEEKAMFPLINPTTKKIHEINGEKVYLDACELFDLIVDHAWQTGEPGIIFIDRMNRGNPTNPSESIEATNPCGEQPLPPFDSCNLGSVNLGNFIFDPLPENYSSNKPDDGVDWNKLGDVVRTAVHFLDNVIDLNRYPISQIEKQTLKNRRIGLGVMGWADMLAKLKLPYNNEKAYELADKISVFIESEGHKQSSELAKTRGKFPNWDGSIYKEQNISMRNATVTTIAPTGTISIIAGCSSGIEPYYSIAFERNVMDGTRLTEINLLFKKVAIENKIYSDELIDKIKSVRSISNIEEIPEEIRAVFLTATDVSPSDHIKMQAVFQKNCDSSVSKTINFAESAKKEDVKEVYFMAFQQGCKGVTIYRDNSRPNQVLSIKPQETVTATVAPKIEERPIVLEGVTEKIKTGYGNLYVTINVHDGRPFEVFAHIGKSGYTTMADTEAICRLISLALRSHVPVEAIIKQLRGIGGSSQIFSGGAKVFSIPDAIAQILSKHFGNQEDTGHIKISSAEICPQCSAPMRFESGCFNCVTCGYSNC
jgi:ribonucleoside-diphosphate reductase alpha chain